MNARDRLHQCEGFDWDEGNKDKNWESHQVTSSECEEALFNQPSIVANDEGHSIKEPRYYALSQTMAGRKLFVVLTIRKNLIRVISARDMSRKERKIYEEL